MFRFGLSVELALGVGVFALGVVVGVLLTLEVI